LNVNRSGHLAVRRGLGAAVGLVGFASCLRRHGEEPLPAVVAAGNAFFDATGVRMRQFPHTPQRVVAALKV
jgi:hypothetical protein